MCACVHVAHCCTLMWYDALLFVEIFVSVMFSVWYRTSKCLKELLHGAVLSSNICLCIIKAGPCVSVWFCVNVCVFAAHPQCCVINDSGGEWTLAVSPVRLFWADLVWAGHTGDLSILGHCLTCTSASALQGYYHLLRGGRMQFLHKDMHSITGKGHTFFPCILSHSVCKMALWKARMARWKGKRWDLKYRLCIHTFAYYIEKKEYILYCMRI